MVTLPPVPPPLARMRPVADTVAAAPAVNEIDPAAAPPALLTSCFVLTMHGSAVAPPAHVTATVVCARAADASAATRNAAATGTRCARRLRAEAARRGLVARMRAHPRATDVPLARAEAL